MSESKYLLVLVALSLNACLAPGGGSGTGNPERCTASSANPQIPWTTVIMAATCGALHRCHADLDLGRCMTDLQQLPGLASRFGSNWPDAPQNFDELSKALAAKTIRADSAAGKLCIRDLEALDCASGAVQDAYIPGQSESPFSKLAEMIPDGAGSCATAFAQSEKESGYEMESTGPSPDPEGSDSSGHPSNPCL